MSVEERTGTWDSAPKDVAASVATADQLKYFAKYPYLTLIINRTDLVCPYIARVKKIVRGQCPPKQDYHTTSFQRLFEGNAVVD